MTIKGFPLPPNLNRAQTSVPTPTPIGNPPSPTIPQAPAVKNEQGALNENEVDMILRIHLKPVHREDPNVLRFIAAYMHCRSASQAAREAGLDARSGQNLRTRPDIHSAIEALTQKSVMKFGFDASEVVERVKEIALVDLGEFENEDGTYKTSLSGLTPETRRAIKKFKAKNIYENDPNGMRVCVGQLIEVEVWDKMKSLELLGREKDLFTEKKQVQHDVTQNMAAFLLDSTKRAEARIAQLKDVSPEARAAHALMSPTNTIEATLTEEVIEEVDNEDT